MLRSRVGEVNANLIPLKHESLILAAKVMWLINLAPVFVFIPTTGSFRAGTFLTGVCLIGSSWSACVAGTPRL